MIIQATKSIGYSLDKRKLQQLLPICFNKLYIKRFLDNGAYPQFITYMLPSLGRQRKVNVKPNSA